MVEAAEGVDEDKIEMLPRAVYPGVLTGLAIEAAADSATEASADVASERDEGMVILRSAAAKVAKIVTAQASENFMVEWMSV